jgi:hypothetical protein
MLGGCLERLVGVVNIIECELWTIISMNTVTERTDALCETRK